MNNTDVNEILIECRLELTNIMHLLSGLGEAATPTPYVKRYALIRATGAIESGFKQIIADKVDEGSHEQVKCFIKRKIRNSSCNPSLGAIENMLGEFDERWRARFEELLSLADKPVLKGSMSQLVNARNDFAHGGSPEIDINDTIKFFEDGFKVLEILDEVVNSDYDQQQENDPMDFLN